MPNKCPPEELVSLSERELEPLRLIAERTGQTVEEVASSLVSGALAQRVRRKTGKTPAKVYPMRRRT